MDYLSYTNKVYQLVHRYSLVSVLLFDREYRKLHPSMGFQWGTDVQHLHKLFLQFQTHIGEKKLGIKVTPSPGLHFDAWEEELENDPDKDFLLDGIKNEFNIIDEDIPIAPVKSKNHPSAQPNSPLYKKATQQILKEIESGHYIYCDTPPKIISPMAAFPKPDGDVRLIHDCSRPSGKSVNDYCSSDWKQKFSRVDDASALMTEGCFFAKTDLKHAYRSIKISEHSQSAMGLKWNLNGTDVYLKDTRLCFGAKLSPGISTG